MIRSRTSLLATLSLLLFLSGASALIYQVLWLRVLGWIFGVTVYAASSVWASFMAGLAIGRLVARRAGDRVRRPLVWFGCAQLLIGVASSSRPVRLDRLPPRPLSAYPSPPPPPPAL